MKFHKFHDLFSIGFAVCYQKGDQDTLRENRARCLSLTASPSIEITRCRWSPRETNVGGPPRVRARTEFRFFYRGRTKRRNEEEEFREQIHLASRVSRLHGSLTASGNRDEGWTIDASLVERRSWFWLLDFDYPVHYRDSGPDSLDLPVERGPVERFLARFSCVRHLELRSRHQARRPRERSNLNIATCFLRRSRKIWSERDGHFEGPCWLSGGAIVGEPWLHRCGYITLLRALTWQGSVFVTCNDARTHIVVTTKFPFCLLPCLFFRLFFRKIDWMKQKKRKKNGRSIQIHASLNDAQN